MCGRRSATAKAKRQELCTRTQTTTRSISGFLRERERSTYRANGRTMVDGSSVIVQPSMVPVPFLVRHAALRSCFNALLPVKRTSIQGQAC